MPRNLPPLHALHAFEAAGRYLSFSRAADEIHVTHGAVSRQIRALERFLGVRLFLRAHRTVTLTPVGSVYYETVRDILDRLAEATTSIQRGDRERVLNVSTLDSFAVKWLLPRLRRFHARAPEVDVQLSTGDALSDFLRDSVDVAIRLGRGNYSGLVSDYILAGALIVVCSPQIAASLKEPRDVIRYTLIHDGGRKDWRMWLITAGVDGFAASRGPLYPYSNMAIDAAIQGDGIALVQGALVTEDLKAGRLVKPFKHELDLGVNYYLVYPAQHLQRPSVKSFRDWLLAEIDPPA